MERDGRAEDGLGSPRAAAATKLLWPSPDCHEATNLVDRCPAGQQGKPDQNVDYNTSGWSPENENNNKLGRNLLNRGRPSKPARDGPV